MSNHPCPARLSLIAAVVGVIATLPLAATALAQEPYKPAPGPFQVEQLDETWADAARPDKDGKPRQVPVRIYIPTKVTLEITPGQGKYPVIVFSHGLGGTRQGYAYLGRHLASHGYLVIHPQHAGSDLDSLRQPGERLIGIVERDTSDPANLENRPRDVTFVLDQVAKHERLSAIADLDHAGVAGHSFGAYTALACAGMTVDLPAKPAQSWADPRIKAAAAMSGQGSGVMGITEHSWDKITVPVLIMTGTNDRAQGGRPPAWRHEPFDHLNNPDTFFLNIKDATHMTFSGRAGPAGPNDAPGKDDAPAGPAARHLDWIRQTTTAFFDAYLRNDAAAKQWLATGAIRKVSDGDCAFEAKGAPPPRKK